MPGLLGEKKLDFQSWLPAATSKDFSNTTRSVYIGHVSPITFDMHKMILTAKTLVDQETGSLSFLEFYDLPWVPKRIYWLKELTSKTSRGNHAHRKLSQLFIVIAGSLTIELFDGKEMVSYEMNKDSGQLLIEPGYWRVIKNASQDACLLVLADSPYDEEDYIRDWKAYLEWREEKEVD